MSKPVCLVSGVGPEHGTGAEIARRFSEGGYRVAMLARNADNLAALADKYEDARAYPCDVGDLDALVETVSRVRTEMGAPRVVVHNALRSTRGSILEMDPDDLEKNFRVNATALLHLARETLPAMLDAGDGAILVTGNTSATRGRANWGFFASTKAAQRILAESIAREFGPRGDPRRLLHHRRGDRHPAHPPDPRSRRAGRVLRQALRDRGRDVPRRPPGPLHLVVPGRAAPLLRDLVAQGRQRRISLRQSTCGLRPAPPVGREHGCEREPVPRPPYRGIDAGAPHQPNVHARHRLLPVPVSRCRRSVTLTSRSPVPGR